MSNKYHAKGFWYDPEKNAIATEQGKSGVWYASILEFKVHQILRRYLPPVCIVRQYQVHFKPKTDRYPARGWKCDYAIWLTPPTELTPIPDYLIEAKGLVCRSFLTLLSDLDFFQPSFYEKLILVGNEWQGINPTIVMVDLNFFEFKLRFLLGKPPIIKKVAKT